MIIGIEGQRLFRKHKHGMDIVALELIKNLQKIDTKNEYKIFVKPDIDRCISETANFKIIEVDAGPYPIWEQKALPKAAKENNCDILHCTSNTAPINNPCTLFLTLHDIIYLESISLFKKEGTWYQKFGNLYRRYVVPKIVKKAHTIITVSGYEKNTIGNYFQKQRDKINVVYNGAGEHFKKISDPAELKNIKEKYNLPSSFVLFLGNTDPKKNTYGALKAFSIFKEKLGEEIFLVMPDMEEKHLQNYIKQTGDNNLRQFIHLTGYIDNKDLPAIFSQAELYLYPSIRESFGIPLIESMRCGTPVITSNTSCIPEIAGNGALLSDPYSPDDIANAMFKIYNEKDLKNEIVKNGLERSKDFSWMKMAQDVLNLYNTLNR